MLRSAIYLSRPCCPMRPASRVATSPLTEIDCARTASEDGFNQKPGAVNLSDTKNAGEAQIESHWQEEKIYPPNPKFVAQANLVDSSMARRFDEKHFPDCFTEYA